MSEKKKQTLDSPWKQKNMPYITSAERIGREKENRKEDICWKQRFQNYKLNLTVFQKIQNQDFIDHINRVGIFFIPNLSKFSLAQRHKAAKKNYPLCLSAFV